jgi:hypothetical protein
LRVFSIDLIALDFNHVLVEHTNVLTRKKQVKPQIGGLVFDVVDFAKGIFQFADANLNSQP